MLKTTVLSDSFLGEELISFVHPSGLEVKIIPKKQKKAYALFATHYGSMDNCFKTEQDEDFITVPDGIAHFLEHKMFENEDGSDTFAKFAENKASANAFTSNEMTAYLFSTTENHYENLETLIELATKPYFTEENVKKEVGIITQEINMYRDDPYYRVWFGLINALYKKSNLKIDIAGTEESIKKITPEILYRCHRSFYNPHNMLLCVCGPYEAEKVSEICDKFIPALPDPKTEKRYPKEPCGINEKRVSVPLRVAMPLFMAGMKDDSDLSYLSPDERTHKMICHDLITDMLFSKSGEFFNKLYSMGLLNDDFSFGYNLAADYGFLELSGESRDPDKVFEMCIDMIKDALNEPDKYFTSAAFERCKKASYGKAVQNWNTPATICHNLVSCSFNGIGFWGMEKTIAKIELEDLKKLFCESYKPEMFALSVVEPIK